MSDSIEPPGDSQETNSPKQFPKDAHFFNRLRAYDGAAWVELLDIYEAVLQRDIIQSLIKRNLPLDRVDDIVQDTWITVIKLMRNFIWESEEKFYNWFRSMATFHIRNMARKLKDRYVSLEEIDEDTDESGLSLDFFLYIHGLVEDGPETQDVLRESLEIIDQAMQTLKQRDREILLRRILYNESVQQLAQDYGVKPETISVILVRTKQAIRDAIARLKPRDDDQDETG